MPSLGPLEILVIFIVALLVFGPNKLPELARQVGKGLAEFRRVQHHLRSELDDAIHSVMDDDKPTNAAPTVPPVVTEPPALPADAAVPATPVTPATPATPTEPVTVDSNEVTEPAESGEPAAAEAAPVEPGPTPPPRADDAS